MNISDKSKEIMANNNIKDSQIIDYEDPITLLYELYEGKMDAAFISGSYVSKYSSLDKFKNINTYTHRKGICSILYLSLYKTALIM